MPAAERFFRLANEPGATGLSCDERGVHLCGAPLLRRTGAGFEPRATYEIEALISKAYGGTEDGARLVSGLRCVADCLNKGELARAMIAAVFLQLPDLDSDGAEGIAKVDALLKKYDPNEPRDRRGRWTTSGDSVLAAPPVAAPAEGPRPVQAPAQDSTPVLASEGNHDAHLTDAVYREDAGDLTDVAYNGKFHDQVVEEVAELARERGGRVVKEVALMCVNGATARADLIIDPQNGKPMVVIEVKTGKDPNFRSGQMALYPHVLTGWHVWPLNNRMLPLGFAPHEILPPMMFAIVYQKDETSRLVALGLDDVGPKWKIPSWAMGKSYEQ